MAEAGGAPPLRLPNSPPPHGIRVPVEAMTDLVAALFEGVGVPADEARFTADLLVACDRRCVFSHGTRHAPEYLDRILDGKVNPTPRVRVVRQGGATAVLDGDGGLGFRPAHDGAALAMEWATELGVGAVTTRNHFHFGAAGLYARLGLERGLVGMAMSSVRYTFSDEDPVLRAAGASPLSVAVPAGDEAPLVLDMAANLLPHEPELMAQFPRVFFKSLGIGAVLYALGGLLAGIRRPECLPEGSPWEANQGAFLAFFDVASFMDPQEFRQEMDRYVAQARRMQPYPGAERAVLPGGMEHLWEAESGRLGIPVGLEHRAELEAAAARLGVDTPFAGCERFTFLIPPPGAAQPAGSAPSP